MPAEAVCYTQRTRPDNVVLPRPRSTDSFRLPDLHLPDAEKRREPVSVLLHLTVSDAGRVANVALGEASAIPDWNDGVLRTAREWSFVPGTVDGEPTAMCIKFRVTATLQE